MTGRLDCPITGLSWRFARLELHAPIEADDFTMVRHLTADADACQAHVKAVLADAKVHGYDTAIADGWARLDVDPTRWERAS